MFMLQRTVLVHMLLLPCRSHQKWPPIVSFPSPAIRLSATQHVN